MTLFLAQRSLINGTATKYHALLPFHLSSSLFRRAPRSLQIPASPPLGNNTNSFSGFVLFFAVDLFGIALYLKCKVRAKEFNARIRAMARRRQDPAVIGGIFIEGTVCLLIVCESVNAMTGFSIACVQSFCPKRRGAFEGDVGHQAAEEEVRRRSGKPLPDGQGR